MAPRIPKTKVTGDRIAVETVMLTKDEMIRALEHDNELIVADRVRLFKELETCKAELASYQGSYRMLLAQCDELQEKLKDSRDEERALEKSHQHLQVIVDDLRQQVKRHVDTIDTINGLRKRVNL